MHQLTEFIVNHWVLWLCLAGIILLLLATEAQAKLAQGQALAPFQAVSLMNHEEAIVIDIRSRDLFKKGHIINAVNISAEDLKKSDKYHNKNIILVCDNGQNSQNLSSQLKKQGFTQINVIKGGLSAWTQAELPTTLD